MSADCEVAIIGGGPVGLLLGCLLVEHGVDVVVLDRGADRVGTRAIGIHPPGLAALDTAGVGDQVRAEACAVTAGTASCRGRELASLPLHDVLALTQTRTEAMLRSRLGSALELQRPVRAVEQHGDVVALDLGDRTLRARWAVAADGVHSATRRALGIGWEVQPGRAAYLMADVPGADDDPRAHLRLEPDGVVESFPLPGSVRRWVARLPDRPGSFVLPDIVLERTGIRIARAPEQTFVARQHLAASFRRGRIVLVGDAAHEISPIGGQGMNLGWLGAARLAPLLVRALREGPEPLAAYETQMRHAALRAQRRARFNMAMGAPRGAAALAARNAVLRVLDVPFARSTAAGLFTMRGL